MADSVIVFNTHVDTDTDESYTDESQRSEARKKSKKKKVQEEKSGKLNLGVRAAVKVTVQIPRKIVGPSSLNLLAKDPPSLCHTINELQECFYLVSWHSIGDKKKTLLFVMQQKCIYTLQIKRTVCYFTMSSLAGSN